MLHGVREEIGIHQYRIGWHEGGIVPVEERRGDLGDFANDFLVLGCGEFLGFGEGGRLILLETGITLADQALDLPEFTGFLCATHAVRGLVLKFLQCLSGKYGYL